MHMFEERVKKRAINRVAFGVVLDAETEGIFAQPDLLDDVVADMPGFDFQTLAQLRDGLMVRAVNPGKVDLRGG